MNIYTETKGSGDDVVLLHGGCDDHRYMQPINDQLCNRYCVTSLDEPGRGKSPWQAQIKNIHDLADALLPVLPKNAIYINWSLGGLIALSLAARYSDRVKRIINIGSSPKFIESADWSGFPQPGFKILVPMLEELGLPAFLKMYHEGEFASFDPKPEVYYQLNNLVENMEIDLNAAAKRLHIVDETDLRTEFALLKCPIDLIFGGKDSAVPAEAHSKIKALNPKANIHVIPDAQHMMMWTHPVEFNKILEKILSETLKDR